MPNNFPFTAVLWDMDGTLIDSEPLWIEQERLLMSSLGVHWTDADAIHCVGGPMARVDEFMRSKLSENERAKYAPFDLTNRLLQQMEITLSQSVPFTSGAFELLSEMKSAAIPMALVSASSRPLVDAALKSIGYGYFEITISDNDVEHSKPDPQGYLKAADLLGANIESTLIIEDSITGMNAAIASGAYVLGIPHVADLPSGHKVIHHSTLEGLTLSHLSELFTPLYAR